jgi:hypothetical protein
MSLLKHTPFFITVNDNGIHAIALSVYKYLSRLEYFRIQSGS